MRHRGARVRVFPHTATAVGGPRAGHRRRDPVARSGRSGPARGAGRAGARDHRRRPAAARDLPRPPDRRAGRRRRHDAGCGSATTARTTRSTTSSSGVVQVTAQNHEVQVVGESLPAASGFRVSQVNLNDGSVEGLRHRELPIETVQYHPEGAPGPLDALAVFDRFVAAATTGGSRPAMTDRAAKPASVLILGSGPVVIGQAAEFDYAGTQACRALRAEGVRTILVNSNPATIMTDPPVADVIYLEPLTVEAVEAVIAKERPEGLLAGLGGQTALNLATAMAEAGVFERHPIRLLGTPLEAIRMAEDREAFRDLLDRIGQPYAPSSIVEGATPEERAASTRVALETIGLPAIVRPAFTLGGTGGGIVETEPRLPRARPGRPAREPDRPGHGREVPGRLAGDRVRGHARRRRHVHRGLLDGERRPARRAHRRLDRRGAGPDPDRRRPPAAAQRGPGDHPRARCRGRLQRPVRALARLDRVRGHRGQPARQPQLCARLEGDRLPDRPGRGPDRGRAAARGDPERRDRHDRGRVRARPRLRRGQAAALPVRQVPGRRPDPRQPDEGDRRGDGHRPDVRVGARTRRSVASSRRASGRWPRTRAGRRRSTTSPASTRATPTPTSRSAGSTRPARPANRPATPSAPRPRSSCAGSSRHRTAACGGCSGCCVAACRRR